MRPLMSRRKTEDGGSSSSSTGIGTEAMRRALAAEAARPG